MHNSIKLFFLIIFILFNRAIAAEDVTIKLEKGDTFYSVFKELNISALESKSFIESLKSKLDLRKIPEGQEINFYYSKKDKNLLAISVPLKKGLTLLAWSKDKKIISERLSNLIAVSRIKAIVNGEDFSPQPGNYKFIVKKGDNITKILTNAGVSFSEVQNIVMTISSVVDLRKLKPNDVVDIYYKGNKKDIYLEKVELLLSGKLILVKRDDFAVFRIDNLDKPIIKDDFKIKEKKVERGDTILGQLNYAGWSIEDARRAVDAFSTVYDPRKIGVGFSIIFPKDIRVKIFAVTISKKFAVLVTKIENNRYLAKKISIELAKKTVSNLKYVPEKKKEVKKIKKKEIIDQKKDFDSLKLSDEENLYLETNLIEGRIEKGDSLISRLLAAGEKHKSINKALKVLGEYMDPNLIRAGSSIIIALGNNHEPIRGFYIAKNKDKGFLVQLNNQNNFIVEKHTEKEAKIILAEMVKPNLIKRKKTILVSDEWKKTSLVEPFKYNVKIFTFKNGDTLSHAFKSMKIAENKMFGFVNKLKNIFNPKKLRIGQKIKVYVSKDDNNQIMGLIINLDKIKSIEVFKENNNFVLNKYEQPTIIKVQKSSGEISSSLYLAAKDVGLPIPVLMEMVKIYSYDVDFQREIKKGDGFEVLYAMHYNKDDELVRNGPVKSAVLILGGERLPIYRYEYQQGFYDYFDFEGRSVRKALMRTPLDGARITSSFGKRKHPILGYTKMHKGVDFGASRNTPVYAAGDGIIEYANRNGSYGKYIRIRHNSDYKTAYAHLAKFAKFVKKGKRVKQGEVIGYVGTTGRSTGPHLHYEIIFRGKQVNPLKIRMPKGLKLKNKNYEMFIEERNRLDVLWNSM